MRILKLATLYATICKRAEPMETMNALHQLYGSISEVIMPQVASEVAAEVKAEPSLKKQKEWEPLVRPNDGWTDMSRFLDEAKRYLEAQLFQAQAQEPKEESQPQAVGW